MVNVFSVPVFFVCFRESLETSIIVSVLLAFLKQTLGPEREPRVWWGIIIGIAISLCIGCGMIGAFYGLGKNHFSGTEDIWEGAFGLLAALIITAMGAALLRVSKLQDKWRVKLAQALEAKDNKKRSAGDRFKRWAEKYAMFLLPFITVLREGLEAVVFIGGVGLATPASAFPLAVMCGIGAGCLVGYLVYRGGNAAKLQLFLIISTCFLYLVAAGLFSKAVWFLENNTWNHVVGGDAAETGAGPGSYDIRQSVWHINFGSPLLNGGGGWGVFNSILGWQNSATYGSVLAYNLYWVAVICGFLAMRYNEAKGHWSLMKPKAKRISESDAASDTSSQQGEVIAETYEPKKVSTDFDAARSSARQLDA
ncbi:hypothetical protein B0A49_03256 [Cryomyces minteri]|uniref:Plasma membrane iron permease n=1 Tax=Cryomyces minteri TaxID=331657 RepID=A0A4U0X402_9PEZI|nr:hypothetical protein B0A49_03256 [Cryomyces minteri]